MHKAVFHSLLFGGLMALAGSPAQADVKAGVDAWTAGNYPAAIREWRGLADQGNADAQFNLGQAYKLGRGVPQDLRKAEELFAKAAAQGHLQAADNYGLLLFQRGERARAMPYISAGAERGDPRAEYLLGIALFNGDIVHKDWVRAYALVSLAQQGGLAAAAPALAQMDRYIPLDQRQASVALAGELASRAEATRARQLAAVDLGGSVQSGPSGPMRPPVITAQPPVHPATPPTTPATDNSPHTAGADFARPRVPVAAATQRSTTSAAMATPAGAAVAPANSAPAALHPAVTPKPAAPAASTHRDGTGSWRIQLGAFSQASNADAALHRATSQSVLSGHNPRLVKTGRVTKLEAGGFASRGEAQSACDRLRTAGFDCIAVRP